MVAPARRLTGRRVEFTPKCAEGDLLGEALEALETIRTTIKDSEHWWMDAPDRGGFDLDRIEAILAKATGEGTEE